MMSSLSKKISFSISLIDRLLMCESALLDCSLLEMANGLLESIKDDGSVSYIIGKDGRYRTTPLASVIEALYDSEMLPEEVLQAMQDKLYEFKDTFIPENPEDDVVQKYPEDLAAWSVDEGPSVWTTAKAVYTLIKTGFHKNCEQQQLSGLDCAVDWLAKQAYKLENGSSAWGFQNEKSLSDCEPSIPMTALALKAIGIAYENRETVHKGTNRYKYGYFNEYMGGIKYLIENLRENGDKCYWEYKETPSITATVWALEAMETLIKENRDVTVVTQARLKEIKERAVKWIVSDGFPDFANDFEPSEPFFEYQKTKYKEKPAKRIFYSFVPYCASYLLKNGASPFEAKICSCIRWLITNKERNWAINDYNSPEPCSFSAAMAINVIVVWLESVNERTYKSIASRIISSHSFEDICKNCEIYDRSLRYAKKENDVPGPMKRWRFAALFTGMGAVIVIGIVWLLKGQVINCLSNDAFVSAVGWALLSILGAVIGMVIKTYFAALKKFFQKKPAAKKEEGESLKE